MPTKIRLQRHGKKGSAFFHLVAADGRAPRDGKFIEKLGTYNPTTNPATIDLNFERCLHWVQVGAEPTDTARAILRYKGVMMKDHLLRGVTKGAMTVEQAEAKFATWTESKDSKISGKVQNLEASRKAAYDAKMKNESEAKDKKAAAIAAKSAPAVEEAPVETTEAETEATDNTEAAAE
jgi:small subunit ribosomal protein S16